jgi:hypothetical protein
MALARAYAYEWAEGNKGDMPRAQGSNFQFLIGNAKSDYDRLSREYRRQDRETVDNWYETRRRTTWLASPNGYYNAIGGVANPGAPW